jgi:hypothetical protein
MPLLLPMLNRAIKFHTISFDSQLEIDGLEQYWGWHIFPPLDPEIPHLGETALTEKISQAMTYIRSGVAGGVLENIALAVSPGDKCQAVSLLDEPRCEKLRLGEEWTVSAQMRIPEITRRSKVGSRSVDGLDVMSEKDTMGELIDEIQMMLQDTQVSRSQNILRATLQYTRLLPLWHPPCEIYGQCTVKRVSGRSCSIA